MLWGNSKLLQLNHLYHYMAPSTLQIHVWCLGFCQIVLTGNNLKKLDPTKIITIFSIPSTYRLILPNRQLLVDTRKVYENCSTPTVKTPERRLLLCLLWTDFTHYFCIFIVALNKLMLVGYLLVSWHLFLHKSTSYDKFDIG